MNGIPVPVLQNRHVIVARKNAAAVAREQPALAGYNFALAPLQKEQCCWVSAGMRKQLREDGNQFSVAFVAAIYLGTLLLPAWGGL